MSKKNNFLRALISVLAIVVLLCGCSDSKTAQKDAYPTPTDKFFVNDYANVLSDTAEEEIYSRGVALKEKTTAQAVVVTVETTGDEEIADYALKLGREWGIGTEKEDNGILILLAVSDREVYIAVGYGLEGAMPDSKTGRILDNYAVPYFSEDNFSDGMASVYKAVVNEIYIEYGFESEEGYVPIEYLSDEFAINGGEVAISWVALIVIVLLYLLIFRRRGLFIGGFPFGGFYGGTHFRGGRGGGFGGGSFGGGGAGRKF